MAQHFGQSYMEDPCGLFLPAKEHYSYTAADHNSDHLGLWDVPYNSGEEALKGEREPLQARINDLIRNYGKAAGIIELVVEHLCATWTPSPQPNEKLLDDWETEDIREWKSNIVCFYRDVLLGTNFIDASEEGNFRDQIELGTRMRKQFGEIITVNKFLDPRTRGNRHREFGTAISIANPGRVRNPWGVDVAKTRKISDGFEVEIATGRQLAMYLFDYLPGEKPFKQIGDKDWKRIPKFGQSGFDNRPLYFHIRKRKEPDAVRGVSDFAGDAKYMRMQQILYDQILSRAINQNKRIAKFSSANLTPQEAMLKIGATQGAGQQSRHETEDQLKAQAKIWGIDEKWVKHPAWFNILRSHKHHDKNGIRKALQGAQILFTSPDEDFDLIEHDNSQLAATDLNTGLDSISAATHSIDSNTFNRNYEAGSYSSRRAGKHDFDAALNSEKRNIDRLGNGMINLVAEEAVERGMLKLPQRIVNRYKLNSPARRHDYFTQRQRALMAMNWSKPAPRLIEPNRDADGQAKLVEKKFKSQSEASEELSGKTHDEQLEERAAADMKEIDHELSMELYRAQERKKIQDANPDLDFGSDDQEEETE